MSGDLDSSPTVSPLKTKTVWYKNRPRKKDAVYYTDQSGKFKESFKGNEFLTIPESLKAVNSCIVSMVTTDVKGSKLIGVSRQTKEEALKILNINILNISPKVIARRSDDMWNILLATEQEENS